MNDQTPSLADALATVQTEARKRCPVARLIDTMPAAEAATLRNALADLTWSAPQIARALKTVGIQMNYGSIKQHRGGRCSCGS